jgi:hypothetical protein
MVTILPRPWRHMYRRASRAQKKVAPRLILVTRSHSCMPISITGVVLITPAQWTSASTLPNTEAASENKRSTCAPSVTSVRTNFALPPWSKISSAVLLPASDAPR